MEKSRLSARSIMVRELVACAHGGGSGGSAGGESRTAARYPAARLFLMIVIGTLPLFLVLPVNDYVEQLYSHTAFIGIALILTGCILYVADKMALGKKTEGSMRIRDALIIGVCQGIATIPGLSRSGTTIAAGMATGLRRDFAVKYSFLLSLPAVLGANILSLVKAIKVGIDASLLPAYLIGMPLDAILLSALTGELSGRLTGGRIDKVQMPERDALLLSVRGQHENLRLLISCNVGSARIHLTGAGFENPAEPPMRPP